MPTYKITYEISRKFRGKLRDSVQIFAMTEGIAKKMFYAWAKMHLKLFATIKDIEEI
jgi:hypothetical protein